MDTTSDSQAWTHFHFAAIEAARFHNFEGKPMTDTIGHADDACPQIKGNVVARATSLFDWCTRNEWFDGEYVFGDPWPCRCVPVEHLIAVRGPAPKGVDIYSGEVLEPPAAQPEAGAKDALAEAYEIARNLGRKFEVQDLTDSLRAAAHAYADGYTGDFSFMLSARRATRRSDPMLRGILNCLRAEALRSAPEQRPTKPPVVATNVRLEVPPGKYDVPADGDVVTLEISHETDAWAGWIIVRVKGEKVGQQRPGDTYCGRYVEAVEMLARDPLSAAARFGRRTTVCGICGVKLEDPKSVERGVGPICAARFAASRGE